MTPSAPSAGPRRATYGSLPRFVPVLLLAGACGLFFFYGLAAFGLVGADEPRYAQIAREMLARGDWITPTLGGRPWLEKPILYYWEAMLAYQVFGVSDWAARLPAAANASLLVGAVYFFLRKFGIEGGEERRQALEGAAMVACSAGVVGFARAASMDMLLGAMFTLAMLAWYAWYRRRTRWLLAWFYIFLGLGMLAKGPVAVVLAGAVILAFAGWTRSWGVLREMLWAPGMAAFCLVAVPWYVAVELRNPEFFRVFILEHNLARFGTNRYHHQEPFWYYGPVTLLALMPWTAMAAAAVWEWARGGRRAAGGEALDSGFPGGPLSTFLLLWLGLPLAFFSCSQSKLPGYLVPALPAATLWLGQYLSARIARLRPLPLAQAGGHGLCCALPFFGAWVLPAVVGQEHWAWTRSDYLPLTASLALAVVLGLALAGFGLRGLRALTLLAAALTLALALYRGAPALDQALSMRPAVNRMRVLQAGQGESADLPVAVLRLSREAEYGLQFYTDQTIARYEQGEVPRGEHILIAPRALAIGVRRRTEGRRILLLGSFDPQGWDLYRVSRVEGP